MKLIVSFFIGVLVMQVSDSFWQNLSAIIGSIGVIVVGVLTAILTYKLNALNKKVVTVDEKLATVHKEVATVDTKLSTVNDEVAIVKDTVKEVSKGLLKIMPPSE